MANRESAAREMAAHMCDMDRTLFEALHEKLSALGYVARKVSVRGRVVQFVGRSGRAIVKVGLREGETRAFYALKFYACTHPPARFRDAAQAAAERSGHRYRCVDCGACGEPVGERGYPVLDGEGRLYTMCGAYVVDIHDLQPQDLGDMIGLIETQHAHNASQGR